MARAAVALTRRASEKTEPFAWTMDGSLDDQIARVPTGVVARLKTPQLSPSRE
jgi:hypothetical protein